MAKDDKRRVAKEGGGVGREVEREFITLRDLQEVLGIGSTKAYELVNTPGGIPSVRVGRAIRISRRDLEDWLEQQKVPAVHQ
jgi:excisionase family DNA binding protein